jgi:CDP-glycerol glycerophosphotransferase
MQGKERLNQWTWKDYVKNIIMILIKIPIWGLQLLTFWLPLKKNRILIYSLKQHGYSCNLKYLTEYLMREHPGEFEILWAVKRPEDLEMLRCHGIPAVLVRDRGHFRYRMGAGIIVTNDEFYPMFLKRRGQLYVNTWHGGINYKKIGYEGLEFTNPIQKLIYQMNNPCPDAFVSGSRSFTDTASFSFRFPKEIFLECGMPRNDILVQPEDPERSRQIRKRLGIPEGKKVLLYAPTFRKGNHTPAGEMDFGRVLAQLSDRFGGEWTGMVRNHYFVDTASGTEDILDVSKYEDMQELLMISDCLISDYSSCMWDYLLTDRPCFVFAPDAAAYEDTDRSFFIPMEKWPYPISETMDILCHKIAEFDPLQYTKKINNHRLEFGSHDTGVACKTLADLLLSHKKRGEKK